MEIASKRITRYGVALLAIGLIGLFLRVFQLGTQSIWWDEALSVWVAKMSVPQLIASTRGDWHPPLYYVVLHYWMSLFGASEFAVRLLSALFGVLAIPMIYLVGRQLFNKEAGLVSAFILAISAFNIQYSQEVRMYSLMLFLALSSVYFFLRFMQRSSLASSVGYVLSTALLAYTHYFGLFVIIAQNIYLITLLVLSKHRTYQLKHWVVLQAIVLALFVPWMAVLSSQFLSQEATGTWLVQPTPRTIIGTFVKYSGGTVLLALFFGLSVLSLFAYQKVRGAMDRKAPLKALESYLWEVRLQDPAPVYFLVVLLLAINLIPFIVSLFRAPIYLDKYAIAGSVALYLLVAKGISNINSRYAKIAVVGIIVVLSVANLQPYYMSYAKGQARDAFNDLNTNVKSGDVVILFPEDLKYLMDYYNGSTGVDVKPFPTTGIYTAGAPDFSTNAPVTQDNIKELKSDVNGYNRVWFVNASGYGSYPILTETVKILNETHDIRYSRSFVVGQHYDVRLFEKRN